MKTAVPFMAATALFYSLVLAAPLEPVAPPPLPLSVLSGAHQLACRPVGHCERCPSSQVHLYDLTQSAVRDTSHSLNADVRSSLPSLWQQASRPLHRRRQR